MNMISKQLGLTLVEILVALVISLFLLGGIVQVYLGNQTSFRFSDASARIQENGRFAIDTLVRDLRLAGFFGCVDVTQNSDLVQNHLDSSAAGWNADLHNFLGQRPVRIIDNGGINDSDDIIIKGSIGGQASLLANLPRPGSGTIQIDDAFNVQSDDILLITNCWTTDIFQATGVTTGTDSYTITHATTSGTPGNANQSSCTGGDHCLHGGIESNLDSDYATSNSSVYKLQSVQYTIQNSISGSGEPALWRNVDGQDEELVEGIQRMVVLYGIDTDSDGSPNQYVDSSTILAASDIISAVRIWLVVRSDNDNVLDAAQTYTVNGTDTTAGDQRMYQVFSVTVDLRNR